MVSPGLSSPPFVSSERFRMTQLGALVTVSVIVSLMGLGDSVLVILAVLTIGVPSASGVLTVAAKATVTASLTLIVRSLARVGGSIPGVPAPRGVRLMLPGTKAVLAGRVSDRTAPVAFAVPLFSTTMV